MSEIKKIVFAVGISCMFNSILSNYSSFFVYLSLILLKYFELDFSKVFGFLNCGTQAISGGFQSGIILSSFPSIKNERLIELFGLISILIYYSALKQVLIDAQILSMEMAICLITANTCRGMLKC